jgi:hypothetical protein
MMRAISSWTHLATLDDHYEVVRSPKCKKDISQSTEIAGIYTSSTNRALAVVTRLFKSVLKSVRAQNFQELKDLAEQRKLSQPVGANEMQNLAMKLVMNPRNTAYLMMSNQATSSMTRISHTLSYVEGEQGSVLVPSTLEGVKDEKPFQCLFCDQTRPF